MFLVAVFSVAGFSVLGRRCRILLLGHSFIYWAARFAARSSWGLNLGLGASAFLHWKGIRGMRWSQFMDVAIKESHGWVPDILVVHLGGNDIATQPGKHLILSILADFREWRDKFPHCNIIWSTIIPRFTWRAECDPERLNRARRSINREVCRAVRSSFGSVVGHPGICLNKPELFRSDGVHLSDLGLQLFLEDLQRGLQVEVGLVGGHEV